MTTKEVRLPDEGGPLRGLNSARSTLRLEQIARLRARGIGDHIGLPQLVVCGDQSAGKSSVLEGVTSIPFPRQDGLCTRFPTEILLEHSSGDETINASIIPSPNRTDDERRRLASFHRRLPSFEDLPMVIEEVSRLMGIRGAHSKVGPAFGSDVLRIEVRGPVGLHLSIVDLPGLISVPNEEQTDDDVQTVHRLVDDYISDPRTIILAVVQAGNDIANQSIIKKSSQFDKDGERTVGIITKPDLINQGSERRIALLALNKDSTKLKLGFFLVKNPAPNELTKGITPEQRQKAEIQYFHSPPWKEQSLDPERLGIVALRKYLQQLLDRHIEKELPKVRNDVRKLLDKTESNLATMGEERDSPSKMRMLLTRLAMAFHQLVTSTLNGTYDDIDVTFFAPDNERMSRRLRATVQNLNTEFADAMRERGAKRRITTASEDSPHDSESNESHNGQMLVTETEMKSWIRQVYQISRGKELPGTYNYVLLAELFHEQSSQWINIAQDHLHNIGNIVRDFVEAVIYHTSPDTNVSGEIMELVRTNLQENMNGATKELRKLWQDEQHHPVTYNHYFTDNIQKAREQGTRDVVKRAVVETRDQDWHGRMHISNVQMDLDRFLAALQDRVQVNMTEQACAEALSGLQAYYKVAMKTFVDNVCRQVVERHITRPLPSIFSAEKVAALSDEELVRIAGETSERVAKRKQLQELRQNLESSLGDLRRNTTTPQAWSR
ncbi:dynamin GTPase [Cladophialophora yegresii CBS 114405]|uniref:Dynamin GTPase n=1 Tax=Cladophialophora yegresii CBS 114405 TaxID=1182544 RepID=W9W165_9EURO|nr:dynamin GTPase [Cladophialophora yegresii CBS 114405]EXJ61698.1 dynamin GTPase [Cladophialophora yegresii CBS 114405]